MKKSYIFNPNIKFIIRSNLVIRPYLTSDRENVFRLLPIIAELYPKGFEWLSARLDNIQDTKARCTLAIFNKTPIGITIETPKGNRRIKLSTIFVHPHYCNFGVGTLLLEKCKNFWLQNDIYEVNVTADVKVAKSLSYLLKNADFKLETTELDRYGEGRNEAVFSWFNR